MFVTAFFAMPPALLPTSSPHRECPWPRRDRGRRHRRRPFGRHRSRRVPHVRHGASGRPDRLAGLGKDVGRWSYRRRRPLRPRSLPPSLTSVVIGLSCLFLSVIQSPLPWAAKQPTSKRLHQWCHVSQEGSRAALSSTLVWALTAASRHLTIMLIEMNAQIAPRTASETPSRRWPIRPGARSWRVSGRGRHP